MRSDPQTAAVPIILLSARAGEEATAEGLRSGADDYLVKPFSASALNVPAIALTVYARSEDAARAIKAGYQRHLPKPADVDELTSLVAALAKMDLTQGAHNAKG